MIDKKNAQFQPNLENLNDITYRMFAEETAGGMCDRLWAPCEHHTLAFNLFHAIQKVKRVIGVQQNDSGILSQIRGSAMRQSVFGPSVAVEPARFYAHQLPGYSMPHQSNFHALDSVR